MNKKDIKIAFLTKQIHLYEKLHKCSKNKERIGYIIDELKKKLRYLKDEAKE